MQQVFWINLDQRLDRAAFMEAQFSSLGLAATRIPALAPADLPATTDGGNGVTANLSISERCVAASHAMAWKALAQSGASAALVLEDDAVLSPSLPSVLDELNDALTGLEVIRIEAGGRRVRVGPVIARLSKGFRLRRAYSAQWGTAGYLISASCAARLSDDPALFSAPLDRVLFDPIGRTSADLSWLQCEPGLCIQGDQLAGDARPDLWRSDVTQDRRVVRAAMKVKKTSAEKFVREGWRLLRQGRARIAETRDALHGVHWRMIEFADRA